MSDNKNIVKGDRNIQAGRDINYFNGLNVSRKLKDHLLSIDENINSILPKKIISPRSNYTSQPFSSAKILESLVEIGIPIDVGIQVVESVRDKIPYLVEEVHNIDTSHIRKEVSNAISQFSNEAGSSPTELKAVMVC